MSQKRYRPQEIIGRGAYPLHDLGQLLEIALLNPGCPQMAEQWVS